MRLVVYSSLLILIYCSCNSDTTTNNNTSEQPEVGYYRKPYNTSLGGVQIVCIEANQKNTILNGVRDEWIVLQTDHSLNLSGWYFNAGDSGQDYQLYSTITDSLLIYTHADSDRLGVRDTGLFLSANRYIWNNTDHDTATLYNAQHQIIDRMTY